EERCQSRDIFDVGDGHGDKQLVCECHPHQRAADATETMNCYVSHVIFLSGCASRRVGFHSTGHGSACQMSLAYSALVRSLENFLDAAILRTALRDQFSWSAYSSPSRVCASL